jgi:hypothetical protein
VLWTREGTQTVVAQRLDLDTVALVGEPVSVAEGVTGGGFSVAPTGSVAYRGTGSVATAHMVRPDRRGRRRGR